MAVVRPFRAVRPDPARVDLGTIVADAALTRAGLVEALDRDPRHLGQLLFVDEPRATAFAVIDLLRAGVLVKDTAPSLTVVRVAGDDGERTFFFGALRADSIDNAVAVDVEVEGGAAAVTDAVIDIVAAPVVVAFTDKKGRIVRAMEAETEREPDAAFTVAGAAVEVWVVDDDSAAARLASLVEGASLSVVAGADELARHRARGSTEQPAWALGCFVDEELPVGFLPVGVCMVPATNAV